MKPFRRREHAIEIKRVVPAMGSCQRELAGGPVAKQNDRTLQTKGVANDTGRRTKQRPGGYAIQCRPSQLGDEGVRGQSVVEIG